MARLSFFLAASICASLAVAQEDVHEGCIHMPIVRSTSQQAFGKRAVQFNLANRSDVAYYARLELGTPPQPQFVQLDTGSFELWVNPQCDTAGSFSDAGFCESVGHFDTSQSSTFQSLGTGKSLRYGIGSANISYVRDDITLPGSSAVLKDVQFGVATSTEDEFSGILGIGYGMGLTTKYRNFVDELAAQNITKVKAFTIALGSKDEEEGVIVFGGVDTSKFGGALTKLPIIPANQSPDGVARYWVAMDSVTLTPPSRRRRAYAASGMPVFLDSGSTLTLLPDALVAAVAADFGAASPDANGFYSVDCALTRLNGTLDFAFPGVTIRVPYGEIIRQSGQQCVLGIMANPDFVLLGDTFMRSAYTVFDLEGHAVWMAQYENCGSAPEAVGSAAAFAGLVGKCGGGGAGQQVVVEGGEGVGGEGASSTPAPTGTGTTTTVSSGGGTTAGGEGSGAGAGTAAGAGGSSGTGSSSGGAAAASPSSPGGAVSGVAGRAVMSGGRLSVLALAVWLGVSWLS